MVWENTKLRLGTCSWTAKGWERAFYPEGLKSRDYIAHYAERFSTVEIDASFYGVPRAATLKHWRACTPEGFLFAAKAPKVITHDKFLDACGRDLDLFLENLSLLGEKLGPLLFQFPYYAKKSHVTLQVFLDRLTPFLGLLPERGFQFAVEVRNKTWISDPLLDLLHAHGVALALIDHPWMSRPDQLFRHTNLLTGPFAYIRWLGDRYGIEKLTKVWDKQVLDKTLEMGQWAPPIKELLDKQVQVYGYVNNHYSGHAPEDVAWIAGQLGAESAR